MKRYLAPMLKDFLDDELSGEKFASPIDCLIAAADSCIGVEGEIVDAFRAAISIPNGQAWDASLIQALTGYVEDKMGIISSLYPTDHALTLWDKMPLQARLMKGNEPMRGDIVIWRYGRTLKGRCGLVVDVPPPLNRAIITIEGNITKQMELDREGNSVEKKLRAKRGTSTMHLLGYVRPVYTPIGEIKT